MRLKNLLASVALLLGFVTTTAHAADIYVLTNSNSGTLATNTDFGKIDSATGAYTSIASLTGDVWNLAWNPTAGNFFTTADVHTSATLRTLTTTGTLSASLATIGIQLYGMAYRTTDSTLYGLNYLNDSTGKINPVNGAWSTLNTSPGFSTSLPAGGRNSIMNDTMYYAGNFSPESIGTMGYTASSTYQQIASNTVYANMVLANDGTTMYGVFGNGTAGQQRLYTINPATGALTAGAFITGTNLGTYFHGAGIVPVPEPSTYALAAIASGIMACIARRRKAKRA